MSLGVIAAHYAASSGGGASAYATEVAADNPLLWFRFGETQAQAGNSPFAMTDSSSHAYAGGVYGSGGGAAVPTMEQPGLVNGDSNTAASFNGTSQYAQVSAGSAADLALKAMTGPFTVEAIVKVTSLAGNRGILDRYGNGGSTVSSWLFYLPSGTPTFLLRNAANADVTCQAPTALALNTKTHLMGTYDGTNIRLYVNGSLVTTVASTFAGHNRTPQLVVANFYVQSAYFAGIGDEWAIYDTALSGARAAAHAAAA